MLKKFVYITGALDYLVGLSAAAPAFLNDDPQQFASLIPLGAFLWFAAASLMWASHDLQTRASVVVWQGLVRLSAVTATLVAISMGMPDVLARLYGMDTGAAWAMLLSVCVFDGTVATVYIVGCSRLPGHGFFGLLLGRPAEAA